MATEVTLPDHPVLHEEVNKEIDGDHVKLVEQEEVKDSQKIEHPPVPEETCKEEIISEPVTVEGVKEETPKTEVVIVADKETELPAVESEEKITEPEVNKEETPKTDQVIVVEKETELPTVESETVNVEEVNKEEETLKTEVMASDNETKVPVVEAEEKKPESVKIEEKGATTEVPAVEIEKDAEEQKVEIKTGPESGEKEKESVVVTGETMPDPIEIAEAVAEIAEKKKKEEQVVVKEPELPAAKIEEKKDDVPIVSKDDVPVVAKDSVPADEIAMKKETDHVVAPPNPVAETKEEPKEEAKEVPAEKAATVTDQIDKGFESAKEEEPTKTEAAKVVAVETREATETESKEEKPVDETKSTEGGGGGGGGKDEEKSAPKTSISIMGKVKKSFMKAKKAITGKNSTSPKTQVPEHKEEEKEKAAN